MRHTRKKTAAIPEYNSRLAELRREISNRTIEVMAQIRKGASQKVRDEIEMIEHLEKLAEILGRPEPRPRRRAVVVSVVMITLAIASWLLFNRVGKTSVRGDLELAEVAFVLAENRELVEKTELVALALLGIASLEPSPSLSGALTALVSGPSPLSIKFEVEPTGSLVLRPITLGDNGRATLGSSARKDTARLALSGPRDEEIGVTVQERRRIGTEEGSDIPRVFEARIRPLQETLLDLTLPDGRPLDLAPQLWVKLLELERVREEGGPGKRAFIESTVLGGSLTLEEIDGKEHTLRRAEPLTLRPTAEGLIIRSLRFENGTWKLIFDGQVERIETGFRESRRSLMPTRLQWLQAQQSFWLFWGIAIYLVGLFYGALKWLGIEI